MAQMRCVLFVTLSLLASRVIAGELLAPEMPVEQVIDHYVKQHLTEKQLQPAPLADDCTLVAVRRPVRSGLR